MTDDNQRVAVSTGAGDAPGLNAVIRLGEDSGLRAVYPGR